MAAAKVRKIRLFPNQEQETTLKQWFGTVRWTYNKCVHAIRNKKVKATKKDLRAAFLNKTVLEEKKCNWALDVPYDIRDEGMNDVLKAIDSNKAKIRKVS